MTPNRSGNQRTISLVTSGNVASNPRLVKEARALRDNGYGVRIAAANIISSLSGFDAEIFDELGCEFTRIDYRRPFWRRWGRAMRQRSVRRLLRRKNIIEPETAALALHPLTSALTHEAKCVRADLYIAHNLAALPAAGAAATYYRARLGFDAEDYHCGELMENGPNELELRIRKAIEGYWLPKCQHLTSASPGISQAYAVGYRVKMLPLLNVFPLHEAPIEPSPSSSMRGGPPSLYWFSQTIGENRGLEEMVAALACMKTKAELLLRGNPSLGYVNRLLATAREAGGDNLVKRIKILPVAAPDTMARLAAEHDIGLSLETSTTSHRDICLTNKIFIYLLAGIPVLLSRTSAQTKLAEELGSAAVLVDLTKPTEVAAALDRFFADQETQRRRRGEAWRLGRNRFNWDLEEKKFLALVNCVMSAQSSGQCVSS